MSLLAHTRVHVYVCVFLTQEKQTCNDTSYEVYPEMLIQILLRELKYVYLVGFVIVIPHFLLWISPLFVQFN